MSTNYYLRNPHTPADEDGLHIGLSAAGIFLFQAYPEEGLVSFKAWEQRLRESDTKIFNEYDKPVSLDYFLGLVQEARQRDNAYYRNSPVVTDMADIKEGLRFRDADDYLFCNYNFS